METLQKLYPPFAPHSPNQYPNQATSKRSHAAAPGEKYSAGTRTVGVPSTGSPSRTLAGCVWKDLQIGKNLKLTVDMKREYVKESVAAPPFPSLSFSLHLSLSFCLENCEPIIDRKGNRKKKKKAFSHLLGARYGRNVGLVTGHWQVSNKRLGRSGAWTVSALSSQTVNIKLF